MSFFGTRSPRQVDAALLIARLVLGTIFIAHGAQKLFTYGLAGVAGSFGQMGIPMAGIAGPLAAFVEFFGGIAIILGLLTRLAGLGLTITMLGAIWFVHLKSGFFAPQGIEFPLALIGLALTLVTAGAGAFSVDALISRKRGHGYVEAESRRDAARVRAA